MERKDLIEITREQIKELKKGAVYVSYDQKKRTYKEWVVGKSDIANSKYVFANVKYFIPKPDKKIKSTGSLIKKVMKEKGLTIASLSMQSDIPLMHLMDIINYNVAVGTKESRGLAKALGTKPLEIFTYDEIFRTQKEGV